MIFAMLVCMTCNGSVWQLELNGFPVEGVPEQPTLEQCQMAGEMLDYQLAPFTQFTCAEYPVERQDS